MKNLYPIVVFLLILFINSGCLPKHQKIGSDQDQAKNSDGHERSDVSLIRVWFDRQGPHSLEIIQRLDVDIIYFNGKENYLDCFIGEEQKTILEDSGFRLFVKPTGVDSSASRKHLMNHPLEESIKEKK